MRYQFTCPVCETTVTRTYVAICCSYACRSALRLRTHRPAPVTLSEDGLTVVVPLYAKDGAIKAHTLIDIADVEWVNRWRWSLWPDGYASRQERVADAQGGRTRYVTTFLHRELLGLTHGDGLEGDHVNRNRLDNRRLNLRAVSKLGNRQNVSSHRDSTSTFRGVHWAALSQKWRARILIGGKSIHLGLFDSEEEAGAAAQAARLQHMPYATD